MKPRNFSIIAVITVFFASCHGADPTQTTATLADYNRQCGADFRSLVDRNNNRFQDFRELEVNSPADLSELQQAEAIAFEHYNRMFEARAFAQDEIYVISQARYRDLGTAQVNGYRIDVNVLGDDEARVRFYFTQKQEQLSLLTTYHDAQSSTRTWPCANFDLAERNADREIIALAEDMGEYFWEDHPQVSAMNLADVPANLVTKAEQIRQDIDYQSRDNPQWLGSEVYGY